MIQGTDAILLQARGVSKKFCRNLRKIMLYALIDACKGSCGVRPRTDCLRADEFWAVEHADLSLSRGEILGLVGRNGSGKTTLLRLLGGILPPDTGEITTQGRLSVLLSIGLGYHPNFSVRENAFLEGALLGMTREEVKGKLDYIKDFSGVGEFFDAPISTLSSGMFVRFGFSVALAAAPDILLVDEVLSVTDEEFREKCIAQIKRIAQRGAVIMVSHNSELIDRICTRKVVMEKGRTDAAPRANVFYQKTSPVRQEGGSSCAGSR